MISDYANVTYIREGAHWWPGINIVVYNEGKPVKRSSFKGIYFMTKRRIVGFEKVNSKWNWKHQRRE